MLDMTLKVNGYECLKKWQIKTSNNDTLTHRVYHMIRRYIILIMVAYFGLNEINIDDDGIP